MANFERVRETIAGNTTQATARVTYKFTLFHFVIKSV